MIGLIREKQLGSHTLNSLVGRLNVKATELGDRKKNDSWLQSKNLNCMGSIPETVVISINIRK